MKTAAEEMKKLRPIQEAIMVALKVDSWKEIPETIKSEVTASNLARFMVIYYYVLAQEKCSTDMPS